MKLWAYDFKDWKFIKSGSIMIAASAILLILAGWTDSWIYYLSILAIFGLLVRQIWRKRLISPRFVIAKGEILIPSEPSEVFSTVLDDAVR